MSAVTLDDMKTEYLLVGKDGNIWGVFETEEQAESVRGNQADPEWYRIEKTADKDRPKGRVTGGKSWRT